MTCAMSHKEMVIDYFRDEENVKTQSLYVKVLHDFKIAIFAMIILGTFENYFCT